MRLSVTHVANHMAKLLLQTCLTTSFTSPLEHLCIQSSIYTGLIPDLIMIFIHTATYSLHVTGNIPLNTRPSFYFLESRLLCFLNSKVANCV